MDNTDDDPIFNPNIAEPFSVSRPRHSLFPLAKPNSQQTFDSDSSDEEEHPPQVPRPRPVAGRAGPVAGRARPVAGRARQVARARPVAGRARRRVNWARVILVLKVVEWVGL